MFGSLRHRGTLALAAALAFCTGAAPTLASQPKIVNTPARIEKAGKRGLFGNLVRSSSRLYGAKGAGISMAQQKRTAVKKRGIARNRRQHR